MSVDYYEILGIPSDADDREIKRAYHRLARDLHPDKASSAEQVKIFEEKFAQVSAAYNFLKDATKRAEYASTRAKNPAVDPSPTPPRPIANSASATQKILQADRNQSRNSNASQTRTPMGLTPEKISIAQKAYARGMQHFKEANFLKAIDFFNAAIQNNDTEAVYHAQLSLALIQAHKSATRAIDAGQKAIELDPYNLDYKFNLAMIFETIGSKTNSEKIYEDILRWEKDNIRAKSALAALKKGKPTGTTLTVGGATKAPVKKSGFLDQLKDLLTR